MPPSASALPTVHRDTHLRAWGCVGAGAGGQPPVHAERDGLRSARLDYLGHLFGRQTAR